MKKITFLTLILIATDLFTGCNKTNNDDVRDAFVANYAVTEIWTENGKTLVKPAFTMTVEKSSQHPDMLILNNFANYGVGVSIEANVAGRELSIPLQVLSNLNSIIGTGNLADTVLTITYTETIGSSSIIVNANAYKR